MNDRSQHDDVAAALRSAYEARDLELRERYQRSLPLQDALFDRWERASALGFGDGTSVYNSAVVFGDVTVGADTWVGPYVLLDGSGGGVSIGDHCSVAVGVHIYTHDTIGWALSGGTLPARRASVSIGSCNYLGPQSVIGAGVTIGSRCVIAANSMVNRDVPSATIVGGTPARRLGRVEMRDGEPVLVFDNGQVTHVMRNGDARYG